MALVVGLLGAAVALWSWWRTSVLTKETNSLASKTAALTEQQRQHDEQAFKLNRQTELYTRYQALNESIAHVAHLYWWHRRYHPGTWPWQAGYSGLPYQMAGTPFGGAAVPGAAAAAQGAAAPITAAAAQGAAPSAPAPADPSTPAGAVAQRDSLVELQKHLGALDAFWDDLTKQRNADSDILALSGGWLRRGNNYRLVSEPLNIATYYRVGFDQGGAYLSDTLDKRPHRYITLERLYQERYPTEPLVSSTAWADAFETELLEKWQDTHGAALPLPSKGPLRVEFLRRWEIDLTRVDPCPVSTPPAAP